MISSLNLRFRLYPLIGVTGFEPATSRPPAVRSDQAEPYPEVLFHYSIKCFKSQSFF